MKKTPKQFKTSHIFALFALFCVCSGMISSCSPVDILPTPSLTLILTMTSLPTSTFTQTISPSLTPTPTLTSTLTLTPSLTPSLTFTPTLTYTLTLTPSLTPSPSFTNSPSPTSTSTTILTHTNTPTSASEIVTTGDIQITRLFYDGVVSSYEPDEFVEIKNFDANSIQLQNWTLRDLAEHIYTFPSFVIAPNQTCRIYTNETHDDFCSFNYRSTQGIWNNSGDTAFLRDSSGNLIDEHRYIN